MRFYTVVPGGLALGLLGFISGGLGFAAVLRLEVQG